MFRGLKFSLLRFDHSEALRLRGETFKRGLRLRGPGRPVTQSPRIPHRSRGEVPFTVSP
jgi:hypothetical protein